MEYAVICDLLLLTGRRNLLNATTEGDDLISVGLVDAVGMETDVGGLECQGVLLLSVPIAPRL